MPPVDPRAGQAFDRSLPIQVQRVAVRVAADDGTVLAAGWLRHGDTPVEALARVLTVAGVDPGEPDDPDRAATDGIVDLAAGLQLREARSIPRDLPDVGVRMHLLALDFASPPALGPAQAPTDETTDPRHLDDVLTAWADGARTDPLGAQAGAALIKVQRAGAYAVLLADDRVLLTRLAHSGRWTLPGGGIDVGEQPIDSVRREVYEESGLALDRIRLAGVTTARWTGYAPDGVEEDFQAVQVLYTATAPTDVTPRVVEVDGSTSEVAWVPFARLGELPITYVARSGLALGGVRTTP